jgi:hypothetical protein
MLLTLGFTTDDESLWIVVYIEAICLSNGMGLNTGEGIREVAGGAGEVEEALGEGRATCGLAGVGEGEHDFTGGDILGGVQEHRYRGGHRC